MSDPRDPRDPIDEAYIEAEARLDDAKARAARRAAVLGAVAAEPLASPARPALRQYGGWSVAAVLAIGVLVAVRVYKPAPRPEPQPEPVSPQLAKPAAPAGAALPAAEADRVAPSPPPVVAEASPPPRAAKAAPVMPMPPIAGPAAPADVAPPPPLGLPPVEKPLAPSALPAPAPAPMSAPAAGDVSVSAARKSSPESRAALFAPAADPASRLRTAAQAGHTAEVETLIGQGVAVDAQDPAGDTALIKAVQARQLDIIAALRRHGARLDLANKAGLTARAIADAKADPDLDKALGIER